MSEVFVEANLNNEEHAEAILMLLNSYSEDPLGQGDSLSDHVKSSLIDGLRSHPTTRIFLSYIDQKPAAIAICFVGFSTFNARKLINIHDFAVLPDFRGKGIGKKLMQHVINDARQQKYCKVTLEVRNDNDIAKALYQQMGFSSGDANYLFWSCPLD